MGKMCGRVYGEMIDTLNTSDRLLRLPLFYEMCYREVDQVVMGIKSYYQERKEE
jgi:dTDP-4-amino-4,6-dideoxygalactose transaminase